VKAEHPEWVRRRFSPDDLAAIAGAIAEAERQTSGEIRVHLERRAVGDAIAHARRAFHALGMHRTRDRNAVLVYLALDDRRFAIVGDAGVHVRVGSGFWDAARDALERDLRENRMRDGLIAAVGEIGRALGRHFPRHPDDRNELGDAVSSA
jgi:uncharacterized membrane protein